MYAAPALVNARATAAPSNVACIRVRDVVIESFSWITNVSIKWCVDAVRRPVLTSSQRLKCTSRANHHSALIYLKKCLLSTVIIPTV
jgi:hypothetical protein